jgi:CRISPR/Cas system-associated endoribonuclease Cas2
LAERSRLVVAYDIRDPARLRRDCGACTRPHRGSAIRCSVFVCDLTAVELVSLKTALKIEMDLRVDSVAILDLGPARGRGKHSVEFLGTHRRLPDQGPTIW